MKNISNIKESVQNEELLELYDRFCLNKQDHLKNFKKFFKKISLEKIQLNIVAISPKRKMIALYVNNHYYHSISNIKFLEKQYNIKIL